MKRLFLLLAAGWFLTAIAPINIADFGYDVKTHQVTERSRKDRKGK